MDTTTGPAEQTVSEQNVKAPDTGNPVHIAQPTDRPSKPGEKDVSRVNRIAILCLLLLVTLLIYPIMKIFFVPIILAATFVTLSFPLYLQLQKLFRGNKFISSLLCCCTLFLCIVIPAYLVMHVVLSQMISFYQNAVPVLKEIISQGSQSTFYIKMQTLPFLKHINLSTVNISSFFAEAIKTVATIGPGAINKTSAGLFGFVADILIMFFTMFYFFIDGTALVRRIQYLSPIRDDYEELIFSRFLLISRATVYGTLIIGLTQGTLGALALLIFGIKSWLLWGFVMVILSLIPVVGAWVVLIPAGCIQLLSGNIWQGIGILVFSTAVISNVDNLMRPRLVGKGAKLHDLVIFFSSLGGIAVFGVMGFIVGPVIAALFISVLDIYSTEFETQLQGINKKETGLTTIPGTDSTQ